MQRVHTLAQCCTCTIIEEPGLGLHSLQDVHTLICRLKSSSLNSPSICESESCTELEEERLNKYTGRPSLGPVVNILAIFSNANI